ncbi:MAG: COQ9 family protein [Sphingobium sp.]|nr:COQ9 family protein [Sphingobium sp.]
MTPSTATGLRDDETLDDLRLRLAPLVAANAGFDGWTAKAVDMAADQAGVDRDIAALAFKGGPVSMISAWFASVDAAMSDRLGAEALAAMKIRARITALVEARLTLLAPHREALRRAQAILAMPQYVSKAARLGWHAANVMWRAAGDTAADYNHYTKRATLGTVYAATLLTFVNDESEDFAETRDFLARRIEDIMRFEKAKAKLREQSDMHFSPARFLGRLRYRAGQR